MIGWIINLTYCIIVLGVSLLDGLGWVGRQPVWITFMVHVLYEYYGNVAQCRLRIFTYDRDVTVIGSSSR